ncbi:hypothetical protein ACLK19_24705 [Escherichia coli]
MAVEQVICAEQRHTSRTRAAKVMGNVQKPRQVLRLRRGVHLVMVEQLHEPPVLGDKPLKGEEGN